MTKLPGRRTGRLSPAVAVTALALLAAGCSSGSGAPASSTGAAYDAKAPVTITVWHGQTSDAAAVMDKLAKAYTAAHPNVTIKVAPGASTTDELLQKIAAGFVSDTYPDVSYIYGSWAGQVAESGHTLDVASWVKDPAVGWDGLPAASRATATVDGKVIGIPAIVGNLGLIYNKKVFDDAGVAYPTADWSWDDFRAAAKRLTNPDKKIYGTAYSVSGNEDTTWHLWPLLWQKGGKILSDDGKSAAFNSDQGVAALDFLRGMAVDDKSMYLDQTGEKYGPLFLDGRIAMQISGPWNLYDFQQRKLAYGVVPLPGFGGDHQTISGTDLWALFDHHDVNRAHAAFDFSQWLTQSAQDVQWNIGLGNLPLRASEKSTSEFAAFAKDYPGGPAFVDNLANAKQPRPTIPGYVELSKYVGEAVSKVLQGAASSKDALNEAAQKSADALAG